ncbi:MAG: bifunctional folylpolyglutamate synthase/dihydrofolate synthase [Rhodospirillales bacterium]|nr:bifunctional folylpolyglutamate synthase/dihydrofolate synthase [Rhodospirillales bacterium]
MLRPIGKSRPIVPPDGGLSLSSAVILARLHGLHPKIIDLSLDRVERLLADLGRPQDALPPVVHVAGTNGKGSVIAFLRAMLTAAGLRVHVYTSPHLVRFSERIVVAGSEIAEPELSAMLAECEAVNGGRPITVFEITTAAAFLTFARTTADVTLLETGLGGRLDATNVIARPALTVLTPIALDHQSFLGETLAEIAFEKAGILKRGVPCVLARQPAEVRTVVHRRADLLAAPLVEEDRDWHVHPDAQGRLVFTDAGGPLTLALPALAGAHQGGNAGLAIAAMRLLATSLPWPPGMNSMATDAAGFDEQTLARGLTSAQWPARLQRLEGGRLAALLPPGWELWLDGGHNPAAAAVLAQHLARWKDRPVHVIFGMLRSKQAGAFLALLAPHVASLHGVAIPAEEASLSADEAAALAAHCGIDARPMTSVAAALGSLAATAGPSPARVLICGSLYLAGAVLAENGPLESRAT